MTTPNAKYSGDFLLGGAVPIHRLGFGAMRITGTGIWGPPADPAECLATLRHVPELGINFIDTADSYGPAISEPMLREALHPYPNNLVIATKAGNLRTGPNVWIPLGNPDYLLQQVKMSLRWLGVEQITLWQLHRIDRKVPLDEQFGAIQSMIGQGLIRFAGLSEVTVEEIEAAQKFFPVATVQNKYSPAHRQHETVLDYCEQHGIGFIPWNPLQAGTLAKAGSPFQRIARQRGATPAQLTLAWLLKRSPVMIPIPGTSQRAHLEENVAAASLQLSDEEFEALSAAAGAGE
jgi:aryl-alcohol dehydrogenase-like predicted oxidoreductase